MTQVVLKCEQHVSGLSIDRCPVCSGAFMDAGELDRVKQHIRRQTPSRDAAWDLFRRSGARALRPDQPIEEEKPPKKCPQCAEDMVEREWDSSMVLVDVCLDCRGVWLDSEELETLETYFGA